MRSTEAPRETAEDRKPSASSATLWLAAIAVIGGLLGAIAGALLGVQLGHGRLSAAAAGGVAGLTLGLVVALQTGAGRGKRTSVRPGPGLDEQILALKETLASAPRRAECIEAHEGRVISVAVSPDGKTALSAGADEAVRLWDLGCGFGLRQLGVGGPVAAVALSSGGRLAAACGEERQPGRSKPLGVVVVWDLESGHELRRLETEAILTSLAFTPDGKLLLVGGADYLRVWELESGDLLAMISVGGLLGGETVLSVASSPDGKLALCGCYKSQDARLIELSSGECVKRLSGHRGGMRLVRPAAVAGVAFSSDGEQMLTGSWDQTARVWNSEGEQTARFTGHCGSWGWRGVVAVAFLPGGKRALSASEDGTVRLWEVNKGDEIARYEHGGRVCCLATSRDGTVAVSGGSDGVLRTWELPS